ncbi:MAG: glucokinase [Sphingomonas sp.]|nr:MAG: glucokinase [Sphingomonas sp.]
MQLVSVDIGGTHARFAIAEVEDGHVVALGEPVTLKTAEHASLQTAWQAFAARHGSPLPKAAAISVASPITGDIIRLTNNPWVIRPSLIPERLGADIYTVINDFGAVGHAVAQLPHADFEHLCGPDTPLPTEGVTTVCGPGTGLGVAQVFKTKGRYHVLPTEGGHVDYAPLDGIEDAFVKRLRRTYTRVSAERICSGPGIVALYETLAELKAVVIAGGLGLRIKDKLIRSGFDQRFVAKGRFQNMMAGIPVKLITHPQPGLFGAAAAFAQEHI